MTSLDVKPITESKTTLPKLNKVIPDILEMPLNCFRLHVATWVSTCHHQTRRSQRRLDTLSFIHIHTHTHTHTHRLPAAYFTPYGASQKLWTRSWVKFSQVSSSWASIFYSNNRHSSTSPWRDKIL